MSREQWGHGYWKGVADAQTGNIRLPISEDAKFWIANMCFANHKRDFDKSLYSVGDFISWVRFSGLSEKYAKTIYDYSLINNYFEFKPGRFSWCYVSGDCRSRWENDFFVLPLWDYTEEEWQNIAFQITMKRSIEEHAGQTNSAQPDHQVS